MSKPMPRPALSPPSLQATYEWTVATELLAQDDVLAVLGFGQTAQLPEDRRALRVGLEPLGMQPAPFEVWRACGPVQTGEQGALRWSCDGEHLFFAIELDEAAHGGIADATTAAYRQLTRFIGARPTPHLLRLWNYLDAINEGQGDAERYRLFCDGRARGIGDARWNDFPAATAIGRQDGVRTLQVYGLASRHPGRALENPRQVSSWQYPRQYGPTAPVFARGMLDADGNLLISGTAAVVGHASRHPDDLDAQTAETLANLDALVAASGMSPSAPARTCLKAYLRDPADAPRIAAALAPRLCAAEQLLLLAGDICRSELLMEVDGVRHPA